LQQINRFIVSQNSVPNYMVMQKQAQHHHGTEAESSHRARRFGAALWRINENEEAL
jgi:hypothetical protein